ncbi:hypothetical protein BhaS171_00065 [Bacillus phage vB_BhaS-171]|uniref:hypothetical protein n=1 Tax=Bacillus phage vB_BhaS-171 TaxID=1775140 RepID=UPI0007449BD6|nr:hypothetical protein BH781_gp65 [Bacillus phage vB_BhaS-171]ALY08121.1 hypothetical protein BhaS171_00065 [Bacillus phage vB_BhaS-171]
MNQSQYEKTKQAHDDTIQDIKKLDARLNELAPFELAKLEYLYTKVERHAWTIAGYFKSQAKYYEGMAEVAQGTAYKNIRKEDGKTASDAQYESRIAKGNMLMEAGEHEGDFTSWKGFALSYEGARNAIKDMIKAISSEGGGN